MAGIACVGEFHYLHHDAGGVRYARPEPDGPGADRGGGTGRAADHPDRHLLPVRRAGQRRFPRAAGRRAAAVRRRRQRAVGTAGPRVRGRSSTACSAAHARLGVAIHSVRAVPPDQMHPVIACSHAYGAPLHAHLSEQIAENEACLAALRGHARAAARPGRGARARAPPWCTRPISPGMTSRQLGGSRTVVCMCPTTEADLADGDRAGPGARRRGLPAEPGQRQPRRDRPAGRGAAGGAGGAAGRPGRRGSFRATALARAATVAGHACLGWPEAGEIAPGALADLVTVALDTPRLAGASRPPRWSR